LTVTAAGYTPFTSNAFTVAPPAVYTVSGKVTLAGVGLAGVTINIIGGQNLSTTTDSSGRYTASVLEYYSYRISAAAVGFTFSAPIGISNIGANATADFTATLQTGLQFYPVAPCRLVDTRLPSFQPGFGAPSIAGGTTRTFSVPSNTSCGIPSTAAAYSLNVTAVTNGQLGNFGIGSSSSMNSWTAKPNAISTATLVKAESGGGISIYAGKTTDVIVDINGYFAPPATAGLDFYPMSPCRLVDTRLPGPTGLGAPSLAAGVTRTFAVRANPACPVPATAAAYSVNVTAIPRTTLGILTLWPAGQAKPGVSMLNVYYPGLAKANAATVAAGTAGSINAWVTDATDLVVDINGYYAPSNGNGQKFYPVTSCQTIYLTMTAGVPQSYAPPAFSCGIPPSASVYSLNFNAMPHGRLGMFVAWPSGGPLPNVSTLNSYDGDYVTNAAIVPAGANGAITFYATDSPEVIVDINGYFAK
jgi:hypothetical protein